MKILIVDDDPLILSTLEFRLKKDGYNVTIANDGREALQKIKIDVPDIIISDIMMPYISGLELVGIVKEKNISIIMLTTMSQEEVVLEAFDLGADDFLAKPFSPNELSLRVKRLALSKGK